MRYVKLPRCTTRFLPNQSAIPMPNSESSWLNTGKFVASMLPWTLKCEGRRSKNPGFSFVVQTIASLHCNAQCADLSATSFCSRNRIAAIKVNWRNRMETVRTSIPGPYFDSSLRHRLGLPVASSSAALVGSSNQSTGRAIRKSGVVTASQPCFSRDFSRYYRFWFRHRSAIPRNHLREAA